LVKNGLFAEILKYFEKVESKTRDMNDSWNIFEDGRAEDLWLLMFVPYCDTAASAEFQHFWVQ